MHINIYLYILKSQGLTNKTKQSKTNTTQTKNAYMYFNKNKTQNKYAKQTAQHKSKSIKNTQTQPHTDIYNNKTYHKQTNT